MEKTREAGAAMRAEPYIVRMVEERGTMTEVGPLGGGQGGREVVGSLMPATLWMRDMGIGC